MDIKKFIENNDFCFTVAKQSGIPGLIIYPSDNGDHVVALDDYPRAVGCAAKSLKDADLSRLAVFSLTPEAPFMVLLLGRQAVVFKEDGPLWLNGEMQKLSTFRADTAPFLIKYIQTGDYYGIPESM